MAFVIGMGISDGSSVFTNWQPRLPPDVDLRLSNVAPHPDAILHDIPSAVAASTFLIDPPERGGMPELIWTSELHLFVVCTEVRNWLGEHQPGKPEFFPVPVQSTRPIDGKTDHPGYFIMGMIPEVDPFDVDRTVWSGGMYGYKDGRTLHSAYDAPCVVIVEKRAGFHFWQTSHRQGKKFMCSNEFWAFYRKNKFRGLEKMKKECPEE
ncbi:MAG: DUF1629 domain-containing protein [Hyphomicrobiaceae bacterium]